VKKKLSLRFFVCFKQNVYQIVNIIFYSLDHYSQETTLLHQMFGGYLRSQGKYYNCLDIIIIFLLNWCLLINNFYDF